MRKLLLPISALLVFALSFASQEALATNFTLKDQASCNAAPTSGTWDAASSTCTVTSLTIASTDKLTISGGITLIINGPTTINTGGQIVVNGILVNNGDLTNSDTLTNSGGTITNSGTITNGGTITNRAQGTITNGGTITNNSGGTISNTSGSTINNNGGTITNSDTITNSATITNNRGSSISNLGTISNSGSIVNACFASFGGNGSLTGNPVINVGCPGDTRDRPPSIGNDYYNQYGGGITINEKPFDIKNYHATIPSQILKIGNTATFGFKVYDNRGSNSIAHVGMYFHFKGDPTVINADTWISWDKSKGIDIHDPDKIFSKSSVDLKTDGYYLDITFTMTLQKPMPDSPLIMRMWDDKLAVGDVPIWGAIVIVDPNAPAPVNKIPTDQYGDYITLENILDKDGYYIPRLLNKLHALDDIHKSVDINWVYDKGVDKLTMVESDKSDNILGEIVCNLDKKRVTQATVTDHSQSQTTWAMENIFHPQNTQLNRADPAQEQAAMKEEAQKAEKILESMQVLRVDYIPKITLSATANSILDAFRDAEPSQLYVYDPIKEQQTKKLDEYKANKILGSMGVKLEAYA